MRALDSAIRSIIEGRRRARAKARRGCRPTVEGLEGRRVPAVTIEDSLLTIRGTEARDEVVLQESEGDNLIVMHNGVSYLIDLYMVYSGESVAETRVAIDLGGGNDSITYHSTSFRENRSLDLQQFAIDLGDGDDYVDLDFAHEASGNNVVVRRDVSVNIRGDDGNDSVFVDLGALEPPEGSHTGGNTLVRIAVDGEEGADYISVGLRGDLRTGNGVESGYDATSHVELDLLGGDGNDAIDVYASSANGIDIGTGCWLNAHLSGGFGNDRIGFTYYGDLDGRLTLDSHGGWGKDSMTTSIGVMPLSRGELLASADGSWGDDTMTFWLDDFSNGQIVILDAVVDGNLGNDRLSSVRGPVRVLGF